MRKAWSISLLAISLIIIFNVACSLLGIQLPDALTRILGIVDLIALVVLVYTSVKLQIWKKSK